MKRKKAINFLTVTLFAGILLTFTIYIGMDTAIKAEEGDGESGFNRRFYSDGAISEFARYFDYKVFGHIGKGDYIIGRDDWIFEAVDSQNGYERLLDYIGGRELSAEELERFTSILEKRTHLYGNVGTKYMMIVIPDSMNVCSDKVPWYLGEHSENSRLSQLGSHFEAIGFSAFIDPSEFMKADDGEIALYNNTENSINAYGAYCIYNVALDEIEKDLQAGFDRLTDSELDFYTRITDGKTIAKNAGIEMIVKNRTVSLSDNTPENYTVVSSFGDGICTERDGARSRAEGTFVVVECTNSWDRMQLMPYFSNTFDKVIYRDSLLSDPYAASDRGAAVVIQVIRESELDIILK